MIQTDKVLAVIPARGGSKGLPGKNIKLLNNYPLIYYSINAAKKSKIIDRTIISTDDPEIARISKQYNGEVLIRPTELAQDNSSVMDVLFHVLEELAKQKYNPEYLVLLQPTSPLRTAKDIDLAFELLKTNDCDSVISVYELEHSPYYSFKIKSNLLDPLFDMKYFKMRRQDLEKIFMPNGALYLIHVDKLQKFRSFYTEKIVPYIMSLENSVDIDTELDLIVAEYYLKRRKK